MCFILQSTDTDKLNAILSKSDVDLFLKMKHRFRDDSNPDSLAIWKEAIRYESGSDFDLLIGYFESLKLEIVDKKVIYLQNDTPDTYDFTIYSDQ